MVHASRTREGDAVHRDLGFSNSFKFSRGRKLPFSCVARKKEQKRLQHLFRAYTRKVVYGGRIKLVTLFKSKFPSTVYTADALRVRLRRIRASTQNDRVVIRFYPRATSSRAWGKKCLAQLGAICLSWANAIYKSAICSHVSRDMPFGRESIERRRRELGVVIKHPIQPNKY